MKGDYTIEVADFGPITQASIDVRPLTVFIGPSNTGKSYLATLIYALHQCFGGPDAWRTGGRFVGQEPFLLSVQPPVPAILRQRLLTWFARQPAKTNQAEIPTWLIEPMLPSLRNPPGLADHLAAQLLRYFGPIGDLVRRAGSIKQTKVAFGVAHEALSAPARYQFTFGPNEPQITTELSGFTSFPLSGQAVERVADVHEFLHFSDDEKQPDVLGDVLSDVVFRAILKPLCRDAYYFPTDRPGLMQSHQVIVATTVRHASTAALRQSPSVPMLSGVLADFLDQLLRIDRPTGRIRVQSDRLDARLQGLLDGEIRLSRADSSYPTFSYRPKGWRQDLPFFRASSMIAELAPVVLYLRHAVRPGDVVIIDEPEAHLHPAMQATFARELARLVGLGVRVVMTTHSEWILETISNLVRASALPDGKRAGIEGADVTLRPDEVGAWLFRRKDKPKGAAVEEIRLDPQTGLYPSDFDDVSMALYNEGATIFNRLQEDTG